LGKGQAAEDDPAVQRVRKKSRPFKSIRNLYADFINLDVEPSNNHAGRVIRLDVLWSKKAEGSWRLFLAANTEKKADGCQTIRGDVLRADAETL
jgi:hypothetical protein